MDVYDRIDKILAEKSMSRRKLAQQIGIAPSTFQSMMARKRGMTFETLMKITEQLKISSNDFYSSDEPDQEYENLCVTLHGAGLDLEEAQWGEGPDEYGDHYYVWHTDAEDREEDRVEMAYSDLLRIVSAAQNSAELQKMAYLKKRLELDLFWPEGIRPKQ